MALTGLDIFKLLPKKNCKECGQATCLAFAMALAASKTSLDKCPYVSEEAKETLGGASAPPIKLVKVGKGDKEREMGDEVVLFRHDKAFYHPTCFAIEISDKLTGAELDAKIEKINGLVFERVGQKVSVDFAAVRNESGNADTFAAAVKEVAAKCNFALVLISTDPDAMAKALEVAGDTNPLIYCATVENYEKMVELAKKYSCPLAVRGNGLEETAALVEKVSASYKELVIDVGTNQLSQALAELTQTRRLSIKKKFRPFGYPVISFTSKDNPLDEVIEASVFVAKYASAVVLKADEKAQILPLMALRMNIYTDPQKPSQVEPKAYAIGNVTKNSPVYVTTNFSLTYYTVEGEVSGSKIPAYIISCPTDGISVLTGWAAGKFTPDKITEFIKACGIEELVDHRNLVIPGAVAVIKGALEEKSGWKVIVGPSEASGIPSFAKTHFA
ncbi:corrinoid/iron-sulfur protein large subunit [Oxobacter pfennigii]|uniref:Corrinoid/iron-sulfur protein large subunit n=1 Tax=Oxobacter pfennigii TaxID=36849 RepID=A0A0P8W7S4_9CLOT|nr:acetyl-CoA decarbonylase/synthase complex subunit gamma [Oxobacter pfennigii]KPU43812.1 corrinoid/iron-sulfur protein large subunit [Oxobacter pfennigii]